MKKCISCFANKKEDEFYKDARKKDGRNSRCRPCERDRGSSAFNRLAKKWYSMISRCHDPLNRRFHDYGGRGIFVCERWMNRDVFINDVLYLIGPPKEGMTLDRADNDKGYSYDNVRWATRSLQQTNQRIKKSNRTGAVGVFKRYENGYSAVVTRYGKAYRLGIFASVGEAQGARDKFIKNNAL